MISGKERIELSEACMRDLRRHEGLRLKPYKDTVGTLTIGYGRNLEAKGITHAEADYLLDSDVQEAIDEVFASLPWVADLDENRQAILVNMAFNLGINGLLEFHNTLAAVEAGNYEEAAKGMLASKWAKQVGRRAEELATRMRGYSNG